MFAISSRPLKRGDLVLFEADMIHRGDACLGNKTLLFFHFRKHAVTVEEDLQFHVGLLGSMVYGHIPSIRQDKNAYFGSIREHNESLEDTNVICLRRT